MLAIRHRRGLLAGAACVLCLQSAGALADCKVQLLLAMPLTMVGTQPLVTVRLNGIEAHLLLDTGSFFTFLDPEAAKRAGLNVRAAPDQLRIAGVGGSARPDMATVSEFTVGTQTFKRVQVLVYGDRLGNNGADGILGQNFLRLGDMEIDLANGMARLFKTTGCEHANLAYWGSSGKGGELDIRYTNAAAPQILADARVNDTEIHVIFDTGASDSALSLHAAKRAGITPESPGVTFGGIRFGVGSALRDSWIAPFKSFKLDTEDIRNTHLRISAMDTLPGDADMLLGADFFLSHRVFISYRMDKVFFTYNGGPVFDLSVHGAPKTAAAAVAGSAPTASAPDSPPVNAADIDRRAAATLARGDFPSAIALFGQAVAAEPGNAVYRLHRAQALARSGDSPQALTDVDAALQLQPDLTDALMFRAQLRLRDGNSDGARTDFAAAEASAPGRYELSLEEADAYARAGRFPLALELLNRWIAAHRDDERRYDAMNQRCLVRGMLGKELDEALADCNAVRRHVSNNSQVLFNRGIVQLRRKQYDKSITDFNDAIELQPRLAPAIYARGLARLAKGDQAAGEADLRAALAQEPTVARRFRDVDLGP